MFIVIGDKACSVVMLKVVSEWMFSKYNIFLPQVVGYRPTLHVNVFTRIYWSKYIHRLCKFYITKFKVPTSVCVSKILCVTDIGAWLGARPRTTSLSCHVFQVTWGTNVSPWNDPEQDGIRFVSYQLIQILPCCFRQWSWRWFWKNVKL